ncbi:MAG: hypothetical protein AAF658_18265 [Myxococcota bacterium]
MDAVYDAYKPGIDRTLLEKNLRLTPTERLRQLAELVEAMEALKRAPRRSKSDGSAV